MHAFIDAFVIGEGEEVIQEIITDSPGLEVQRAVSPGAADGPGADLGGLRALRCTRSLTIGWHRCPHRKPGARGANCRSEAHRRQAAPAAHPLHRSLHRNGAQPRPDRDHARLHPRLPLLPGRDDHPPRARAAGRRDRRRPSRTRCATPATRKSACCPSHPPTTPISLELVKAVAERFAGKHLSISLPSPAHRVLLSRADGRSEGVRAAAASPWRRKPPPSACARSSTSRSAPSSSSRRPARSLPAAGTTSSCTS